MHHCPRHQPAYTVELAEWWSLLLISVSRHPFLSVSRGKLSHFFLPVFIFFQKKYRQKESVAPLE